MAIIPRYTSRALPPGAQAGLITGAQSRGEAGAGLAKAFGGAVVEGIDYARRRDEAAKTAAAAKLAERIAAEKRRNENLDLRDGESALAAAEAETTRGRARAVASARTGGVPAKDMARISLADFAGAAGKQAEALKTRPHLKARFDAMVESSRAPHELRMLTLENERRAGEEKTVLATALGELAQAATDDPAMAPGVAGRGLAQIENAMDAGMVTPEEAAAMQAEFADNVHMSAMRGHIAQDPAQALAKLESGELDDIFVESEGAARSYAGRTPREIAEVEGFDPGFFKELLPGLPLDKEIELNDLVDRGPWRRQGEAPGRDDIVTLLPDRPRSPDIDLRDIVEKLPYRIQDDPGNPSDWLRLAVERFDGEYGLDREKLERLLPGLLAPPPISALELLRGEARAAARVKQAGESAAIRARRRVLENDMKEYLKALDDEGKADEALDARARAGLPDFQYAAFQRDRAEARERHATRQEYAFMTKAEIEADLKLKSPDNDPEDMIESDGRERYKVYLVHKKVYEEVFARRAVDPAGWTMRDDKVKAAYEAANAAPDDPVALGDAIRLRLALQRGMGIEPRLLSDDERDNIAGRISMAEPAGRPTLIAELRRLYGPHAGMLARELVGEVDTNTAMLIAHADMPHLSRLFSQGMEKDRKDGPAKLTVARRLDIDQLPELPILDGGEYAARRLNMDGMDPGQHYRLPNGAVALYDGEALIPMKVEVVTPLGDDSQFSGGKLTEEQASPFLEATNQTKRQLEAAGILSQFDDIKKAEARRPGERMDLRETPREQERLEAAPPTGEPEIADMNNEELRGLDAQEKEILREYVGKFSKRFRESDETPEPVKFTENPEGKILGEAGEAIANAIDKAPVIPDQDSVLIGALLEHGVDPGDRDAVMEAFYNEEFRALLDERRNELAGNAVANAAWKEATGKDYDGGNPPPTEVGEERIRPQGTKAQWWRIGDKLGNAGYATGVDNIMMGFYRMTGIDNDVAPGLLTAPRLAEQQRDMPPGNENRYEQYAAASAEEQAEIKRGMVDDLAAVLENQGKIRDRLKASEARPGLVDAPLAAAVRIGGDALLAIPNMIPGVAQIIGANESFYKTIAEFEVHPKDYRAMAELAVTEKFVEKWKANIDKYMVGIPVDMAKDYVKKATLGILKDEITPF